MYDMAARHTHAPLWPKLRNMLLGVFLMTLAPTACDKVPMNGALDGQWQLLSIATPDGTRDVKDMQNFLCFQLHLTQWYKPGKSNIYAHFEHSGGNIHFFDFAHSSKQASSGDNDEWVTPREMNEGILDGWGVHSTDITYHVRRLDGSRLVLECADTVLTFRKF